MPQFQDLRPQLPCAEGKVPDFQRREKRGRTLGLMGLLTVLMLGGEAPAAEDLSPPSPEEIRSLVDRLASPQRAQREEAERQLLEAGLSILPHLPTPNEIADPAARETLRRIRSLLERRRAEESLAPSRVTWRGRATPAELAAVIAEQTGNAVEVLSVADPAAALPLTVDWRQTTFWEAVGELMSRGKFGILAFPSPADETVPAAPRGVHLAPLGAPVDGPPVEAVVGAAASGVFRWEVVHLERRIPPPGERSPPLLRIQYRLRAEPRLRPLFADYREAELRIAAGERFLAPFNPQASRQPDFTRAGTVEFSVDYLAEELPPWAPLKASAQCAVEFAAAPQEIVFRHLQDRLPIVRRAGNVVVSLDRLGELPAAAEPTSPPSDAGRRAFVRLTLRYDEGGPAFESHRVATVHREVALVPPGGGRRTPNDGQELTLEQDGALGALYRFRGLPADWREGELVCEAPTALLRRTTTATIDLTGPP